MGNSIFHGFLDEGSTEADERHTDHYREERRPLVKPKVALKE